MGDRDSVHINQHQLAFFVFIFLIMTLFILFVQSQKFLCSRGWRILRSPSLNLPLSSQSYRENQWKYGCTASDPQQAEVTSRCHQAAVQTAAPNELLLQHKGNNMLRIFTEVKVTCKQAVLLSALAADLACVDIPFRPSARQSNCLNLNPSQ